MLRLILPRQQAAIALPRRRGSGGIVLLEIGDHGMDRFAEAVDIEPAHAHPLRFGQARIMAAQPVSETQDFLVAPHPCREAHERLTPARAGCIVTDIIVDACDVGPVALDGNDSEAVAFDQPPGDRGAGSIEFMRSMRCFTEEDDPGIAEPLKDVGEIGRVRTRQKFGRSAKRFNHFVVGNRNSVLDRHDASPLSRRAGSSARCCDPLVAGNILQPNCRRIDQNVCSCGPFLK